MPLLLVWQAGCLRKKKRLQRRKLGEAGVQCVRMMLSSCLSRFYAACCAGTVAGGGGRRVGGAAAKATWDMVGVA
jgi:hypothetical protein